MKKKLIAVLVFSLILLLAGCGAEDDIVEEDTVDDDIVEEDTVDEDIIDEEEVEEDVDGEVGMVYEDIEITPEQAFDKFMELHPKSKVKELEIDKELTEFQYVIEGYDDENDYEVKLNPVDGEVISDDWEVIDLDDENAEITKEDLGKVDMLIEKAKTEDGSESELDEWNISVEDGEVVMDIEVGLSEYTYNVDSEELIDDSI